MTITCACDAFGDGDWWYQHAREFSKLGTKQRRRCWSCNELIELGADCGELKRYRGPQSDIEESIYGDDVPIASAYLCETCYGLMLSVEEAGGCVMLDKGENLRDAIVEWRNEYPEGCAP